MDSESVRKIKIPMVADVRGNLSFIQSPEQIPFAIGRVLWIYDVPFGKSYDGEALDGQVIVALSGSFNVAISGKEGCHSLSRPYDALYLPPSTRYEIVNFSTNAVALLIDSEDDGEESAESAPCREWHSCSLLADCRIVNLNRRLAEFGSISAVENDGTNPFAVRRVFYLYDVPADSERGGHSHFVGQEFIVAVSGSFDVILDDGKERRTFTLNRPYKALYIPAGIWREINNFSSGSVCMVLTSTKFAESDYCREYSKFKELTKGK